MKKLKKVKKQWAILVSDPNNKIEGEYMGWPFQMDEDENVVNIALVVEEDTVGVVLPQDRKLKTHTLQELFESKYTSVKTTK